MMWQSTLVVAAVAILLSGACVQAATWQSDDSFFPILPWDGLFGWETKIKGFSDPLESVAECNFTVAGFVQPSQVPECEKLGLKAIISRPESKGPGHVNWLGATVEEIDATVKHKVEEAGSSDTVLGYFITDEPGTQKFPALAAAVAAVKKYAPGKLAYINLFPGYATIGNPDESQLGAASFTEYLEKFVADVKPEILSYDNYKIFTSDNLQSRDQGASLLQGPDGGPTGRPGARVAFLEHRLLQPDQELHQRSVPSQSDAASLHHACGRWAGARLVYVFPARLCLRSRGQRWSPHGDLVYLRDVNRQVKVLGPIMNWHEVDRRVLHRSCSGRWSAQAAGEANRTSGIAHVHKRLQRRDPADYDRRVRGQGRLRLCDVGQFELGEVGQHSSAHGQALRQERSNLRCRWGCVTLGRDERPVARAGRGGADRAEIVAFECSSFGLDLKSGPQGQCGICDSLQA